MKNLITLIIGLLVVGCGKQEQADTNESTPTPNTNEVSGPRVQPDGDVDLPLKEKVIGKWDMGFFIITFNEDGTAEALEEGVTVDTGTWTIKDGKVHTVNSGKFGQRGSVVIYKMNEKGNLENPFGIELKKLD